MSNWVDVGNNVYYSLHTCSHNGDKPSDALIRFGGEPDLSMEEGFDHDEICVGAVSWCDECKGPTWTLHSLDPLHIEPSIQTTCHNHPPHHGHIRGGRWEPC